MPNEIAVLGAYPDGLETPDLTQFPDKWTCWRQDNSVPREIWQRSESLLRGIIRRQGYFIVYPYWGRTLPVEYELRVSELRVFNPQQGAPGETFPHYTEKTANAWLRYQRAKKLLRPIPHNRFLERPLLDTEFAPARPISTQGWTQMWHTGVIFVELAPSE